MMKVVLAEAMPPVLVQQLRALLPEGVEFDAVESNSEEELARRGKDAASS